MFAAETYIQRRNRLKQQMDSGLLVFPGNNESPMNYPDNCYLFRQDSTFLYFWGLDAPGLAATIDIDDDRETLYGHDLTTEEIVWMGPHPTLEERGEKVGITNGASPGQFETTIKAAIKKGRTVHFLPQYRGDNLIRLAGFLDMKPVQLNEKASGKFAKAVISQRSNKTDEEIAQIETAVNTTNKMHTYAMRHSKPGVIEQEISGAIEGIALSGGGYVSFPIIFSKHGETLHNHYHGNTLQQGDLVVNDSGAASKMHYAGDITRTIPVSGKFSEKQKLIYNLVLSAQEQAIAAIKPGIKFREVHLLSAKVIAAGLTNLGLMQGDTDEAVAAGAHALFFPHGLGHMLGLDVHDMEGLGEDRVGYDAETRRSDQFGLGALRFGKKVEPGYVLTVEPGVYFIPQLIDQWRAENKFSDFINYDEVAKYQDFGGIRIEDDVVVTADGCRILGKPIPKTIADIEALASG